MGNVNFEFLDRTPIENVITCLNYSIDKVIFFGYQEVIDVEKSKTERFLIKYCGVKKVVFLAFCRKDAIIEIWKYSKRRKRYEKKHDDFGPDAGPAPCTGLDRLRQGL